MGKHRRQQAAPCPCGSGHSYQECCQPLVEQRAFAATAEQLMRSRYSAYCQQAAAYLLASWHPDTRPATLDTGEFGGIKWIGLQIVSTEAGQAGEQTGSVEFIARFKANGRAGVLQENSRFIRQDGRWYYLDGVTRDL